MKRQQTKNAASAYFFTRSGEVIYFVFLCFYSLCIVKYIILEPTIGGYSHSLLYFIPGSYYFSDILGFILHTVISANRQYPCARRLSNARIRT